MCIGAVMSECKVVRNEDQHDNDKDPEEDAEQKHVALPLVVLFDAHPDEFGQVTLISAAVLNISPESKATSDKDRLSAAFLHIE